MAEVSTEDQIYIVAGALGGVCLILLIGVIVLIVLFTKLRRQLLDVKAEITTWTEGLREPKRILPRLVPEETPTQSYFGSQPQPGPGRFDKGYSPFNEPPANVYPRRDGY